MEKWKAITGIIRGSVHVANLFMKSGQEDCEESYLLKAVSCRRIHFHDYAAMTEYFFWKMCDYFCRYLPGDNSQPVDMDEINTEIEPGDPGKQRIDSRVDKLTGFFYVLSIFFCHIIV